MVNPLPQQGLSPRLNKSAKIHLGQSSRILPQVLVTCGSGVSLSSLSFNNEVSQRLCGQCPNRNTNAKPSLASMQQWQCALTEPVTACPENHVQSPQGKTCRSQQGQHSPCRFTIENLLVVQGRPSRETSNLPQFGLNLLGGWQ
eukprot:2714207-Amphidinium_carterae.1